MPILDLHAHFSFKPANSSSINGRTLPDLDHWRERFKDKTSWSKAMAKLDGEVVKSSQLHGNAATEGGFGLIVNGLYPLELNFTSKLLNHPLATLVGYDPSVLEDIYARRISPFQLLEREYHNLIAGQRHQGGSTTGNRYKVVDSYAEIEKAREQDPATICIVNSIEGGHAFADIFRDKLGRHVDIHREEALFLRRNTPRNGTSWFELYIEGMLANIDRIKTTWEHTPLFVTFAHHYYNHLCGHSPSLTHLVAILAGQHGGAPNESGFPTSYFHLGIRRWGRKVLAHLLERRNQRGEPVRRILIDTKHMSPQARLEYYEIVDQRRTYFHDALPIIASHSAVNGRRSLQETVARAGSPDAGVTFPLMAGEKESTKYFYAGAIGLFDDEIVRIVDSDGIIGLMIDERRIMGESVPPEANLSKAAFNAAAKKNKALLREWSQVKQEHSWGEVTDAELRQRLAANAQAMAPQLDLLRPAYLSVILRQLFHIVELTGERGWDHVALGTDYDGVINPIDIYPQSSDMKSLQQDLVRFWEDRMGSSDTAVATLYNKHLYGRRPSHWVKKLLWGNGMDFLRKYYHDDYLIRGVVPGAVV